MKIGDTILISPDLTLQNEWLNGEVIDVKDNSFVGTVIFAKTHAGEIFFGREELFKPV